MAPWPVGPGLVTAKIQHPESFPPWKVGGIFVIICTQFHLSSQIEREREKKEWRMGGGGEEGRNEGRERGSRAGREERNMCRPQLRVSTKSLCGHSCNDVDNAWTRVGNLASAHLWNRFCYPIYGLDQPNASQHICVDTVSSTLESIGRVHILISPSHWPCSAGLTMESTTSLTSHKCILRSV